VIIKENMPMILAKRDGTIEKHALKKSYIFDGIERKKVSEVQAGDICALTGIEGFEIGDSIM
jgi:GTP-binding protein